MPVRKGNAFQELWKIKKLALVESFTLQRASFIREEESKCMSSGGKTSYPLTSERKDIIAPRFRA